MPNPTHTRDPIFISVKEAGHLLGLSKNQTYDLLNDQRIESRYFGKRRLVSLSSLNDFAANLPTDREQAS